MWINVIRLEISGLNLHFVGEGLPELVCPPDRWRRQQEKFWLPVGVEPAIYRGASHCDNIVCILRLSWLPELSIIYAALFSRAYVVYLEEPTPLNFADVIVNKFFFWSNIVIYNTSRPATSIIYYIGQQSTPCGKRSQCWRISEVGPDQGGPRGVVSWLPGWRSQL